MLKKHFSNGNMKIGKDTLIFNMGSATTCIAKEMGLCELPNECYALKAERQYPQVKPYRDRQELLWKETSAKDFADTFIDIASRKRTPIKYLRMNEAGDFATQADVDKLTEVAVLLKAEGFKTYTYTARSDLDFTEFAKVAGINYSNFTRDDKANSFMAVDELTEGSLHCKMDCRICHLANSLVIL